MSATSSRRTTPRTRATNRSWPTPPRRPSTCGSIWTTTICPWSASSASTTWTPTPRRASTPSRPATSIPREVDNVIVGLQTDVPCKRAMMPNGGWRMVETGHPRGRQGARSARSRRSSPSTARPTTTASSASTPSRSRSLVHNKILTGLPDAYGRGRIIGDYRRVALYGVNTLIKFKQRDKDSIPYRNDFTEPEIEHWIRFREEHDEQIKALKQLINLGNEYGLDLSRPAQTAQEAVQWTYMGYLASVKSQDGAAMSFGRVSDLLRRLLRARPEGRQDHRDRRTGDHRQPGHEAAHRALPAHQGLRRDLLRRSVLGDLVRRRLRRRRPYPGHQDLVPSAQHPDPRAPRTRPGAEHHHLLGSEAAGSLQALLRPNLHRHLGHPVRVR